MSFPRASALAGLVAGLLALSGLSVSPSSAQDAQRPVVGAVFGDSFASGEGLAGVDLGEAECQRALGRTAGNGDPSTAWGVTVLKDLPVQRSWFAACTGARTEHFTKTPQRTGLWPIYPVKRDKTQYAEAMDGTGTERFDVVLASFGGNDLEFNKVIIDCINIDDAIVGAVAGGAAGGWAGSAAGGVAGAVTGRCQPGLDQDRREAIDRLAEDNLPELYNNLVDATTEGALIVVTGYPQLFEDPTTSWLQANALTRRCHGMHFDDADMIRGLVGRLNQAIGAEVKEAAKRHPDRTWVFADVSFPFDGHGLCSDRAEPWINGITTGLLDGDGIFDGDFRYKRSFHPTQEGHTEGYAAFISGFREVEEWQPRLAEERQPDEMPLTLEDCRSLGTPLISAEDKFERASVCLFLSWRAQDRDLASRFGEPAAVEAMFGNDWLPGPWQFSSCQQYDAHESWQDVVCTLQAPGPFDLTEVDFTFVAYDDVLVVAKVYG